MTGARDITSRRVSSHAALPLWHMPSVGPVLLACSAGTEIVFLTGLYFDVEDVLCNCATANSEDTTYRTTSTFLEDSSGSARAACRNGSVTQLAYPT